MRGVPDRVIAEVSFVALQQRDSLRRLFYDPECGLLGDAGVLFRALRAERDSLLSSGLYEFVGIVESTQGVLLSSYQRNNYRALDAKASSQIVQAYVKVENLSSFIGLIVQTSVDLSLLTRSIYKGIRMSQPGVRASLWKEYRVVDRAFRDLLRSEVLLYAPNSQTGKKIPEGVLHSLAKLVLSERAAVTGFMGAAGADSRARDSLVLLKSSTLLTGFGRIRNSQFLGTEDVMEMLSSEHPRIRRGLIAGLLGDMNRFSREEIALRYLLADRAEGDKKALSLASNVLSVHLHSVVRALKELVAENG